MVGIFQMLGISFLFWILMGCIRFIFEMVDSMWRSSYKPSAVNFFIACSTGTALTSAILFLFFANFDARSLAASDANVVLPAMIVWSFAVLLGTYLALRLYGREPNAVVGVLAITSLALGTILFTYSEAGLYFSPHGLLAWALWMFLTAIASYIGGEVAVYLNAVERKEDELMEQVAKEARILPHEVAVLIAAHNEELTIGDTIQALLLITKPEHIFIASDGSKDNTVTIARSLGCNVLDIQPNGGKPRALQEVIKKFGLLQNYKAIFFLDADILPKSDLFIHCLPQFDDPDVAVVVNRCVSIWTNHWIPRWRYLFTAYRIRLWRVMQFCLRYGQTWKYVNASPIVPGGSSIYRTSVLKKIQMYVPGLIIEDFNMTFEIHHKELGTIAFNPRAQVLDQEPISLRDYIKQIKRWYLGFFQTVRHHGIWVSWFFFTMTFFTLELLLGSVIFLITPFFIFEFIFGNSDTIFFNYGLFGTNITLAGILFTNVVVDLIVTFIVILIERKPLLILYWPLFYMLRYIEAFVFLFAMIMGLFVTATQDGKWVSPKRFINPATK